MTWNLKIWIGEHGVGVGTISQQVENVAEGQFKLDAQIRELQPRMNNLGWWAP